jgi:hypothetical protein
MSYTMAEGRQKLLDDLVAAAEEIALALSYVGHAYDLLDEPTGDKLEAELFGPLQLAYAGAQKTHSGFAQRFAMKEHKFTAGEAGLPSDGAYVLVANAADAAAQADDLLAEIQDSMLPVEVGDQQLRAELAAIRSRLAPLPSRAETFLRTLGR